MKKPIKITSKQINKWEFNFLVINVYGFILNEAFSFLVIQSGFP